MNKFLTETAFVAVMLLITGVVWTLMSVMAHRPQPAEVLSVDLKDATETFHLEPIPFYRSTARIIINDREFDCLARNIYYEAVGEDYIGKIAVAQITWNRVKAGRWGTTVCRVVHAPHQFSWTRQNKRPPGGAGWEESRQAAQDFLEGRRIIGLDRSKYYHATWIRDPNWTQRLEVAVVIGQHKFYNRPD